MKYLLFTFLLFSTPAFSQQTNTFSFSQLPQLAYLGIDKPTPKPAYFRVNKAVYQLDGYAAGYKTPGITSIDNKYYFISPNGLLFETDGTEHGTRTIYLFQSFKTSAYLSATNNSLYFGDLNTLIRYNPSLDKSNSDWLIPPLFNSLTTVDINDEVVNDFGTPHFSSELFVSSKKDKLFIRTNTKTPDGNTKLTEVYEIADNKYEEKKVNQVYECLTVAANRDAYIGPEAKIADRGNDVFINGMVSPTGVGETSVLVENGPLAATDTFRINGYYTLRNSGLIIAPGFLRTDTAIYSLITDVSTGKSKAGLWRYQGKGLVAPKIALTIQADDYAAEVHDGIIYVTCKGFIYQYHEATETYTGIDVPGTPAAFQEIADKNRLIKSGDYLMSKINGSYKLYNSSTGKWRNVETASLPAEPNRYRLTPTYAYATSKNFVYFKTDGNKEQLISYSPYDDATKVISLPDYTNETFQNICSFSQVGDKFFIVGAYSGKKNKKTYRMFLWNN